MQILMIVKTGCNDEFRAEEIDTNVGGALLKANSAFKKDGDAWKIMLFDIKKRKKLYTLKA